MSCSNMPIDIYVNDINKQIQRNPSMKATPDGGLSKEVACHEG